MFRKLFAKSAVVYLLAGLALTQSNNGRILGTVTDPSGAVIEGAKVIITDTERGVFQSLVSNESGEYVAPSVRPGLYLITVEQQSITPGGLGRQQGYEVV
jgi:hypothetical protein